jgi:hypothetical protein
MYGNGGSYFTSCTTCPDFLSSDKHVTTLPKGRVGDCRQFSRISSSVRGSSDSSKTFRIQLLRSLSQNETFKTEDMLIRIDSTLPLVLCSDIALLSAKAPYFQQKSPTINNPNATIKKTLNT